MTFEQVPTKVYLRRVGKGIIAVPLLVIALVLAPFYGLGKLLESL